MPRLPKEKIMLHVCLTFRHHYTSRLPFGGDITLLNGSIKRVQQLCSLKPLHTISFSYLFSSNPVTSWGITTVSLFSGLSYFQRKWNTNSDLRVGKETRMLDKTSNPSHPQSRENVVCLSPSTYHNMVFILILILKQVDRWGFAVQIYNTSPPRSRILSLLLWELIWNHMDVMQDWELAFSE